MLHIKLIYIKYYLMGFCVWFVCFGGGVSAQVNQTSKPKLIVGIVVDQMRADFLDTYAPYWGNNGFKRLLNQGTQFKQAIYPYVPTYTGPGHASIYTGETPRIHGIVGNSWLDVNTDKQIYCTQDDTAKMVGSFSSKPTMSPNNLKSTHGIADALFEKYGIQSTRIAIALKDRGAVLPGGKHAEQVYWFDSESGFFVTSTYYQHALPYWVQQFNRQNRIETYLNQPWVLSVDTTNWLGVDNDASEEAFAGNSNVTMPYDLPELRKKNGTFGLIRSTPFGNSLTTDLALAAITTQDLGQDTIPDLLAISYSSTDYIGHRFGPHSLELLDTYARLDLELTRLIDSLDKRVGLNNVLFFLTSDHGAATNPMRSNTDSFVAFDAHAFLTELNAYVKKECGFPLFKTCLNQQLYLNKQLVSQAGVSEKRIFKMLLTFVKNHAQVLEVIPLKSLSAQAKSKTWEVTYQGYVPDRSGQYALILKEGVVDHTGNGTSHGSHYAYDSHVPLLLMGAGIPANKQVHQAVQVTDLAPFIRSYFQVETNQLLWQLMK